MNAVRDNSLTALDINFEETKIINFTGVKASGAGTTGAAGGNYLSPCSVEVAPRKTGALYGTTVLGIQNGTLLFLL